MEHLEAKLEILDTISRAEIKVVQTATVEVEDTDSTPTTPGGNTGSGGNEMD